MVIRVYWASVTGNRKIEYEQKRLRNIIESLRISSEWIDITTSQEIKQQMREECGNSTAMPPQVFNDDRYIGDVTSMEEFVEDDRVREWFGIGSDDVTTSQLSNKLCSEKNVTDTDAKLPTSNIENKSPNPASNQKPDNVPPPTRKHVLSAAEAFESLTKEEPAKQNKSRVIFTQSRSLNTNPSEDKKPANIERRTRILGLTTNS